MSTTTRDPWATLPTRQPTTPPAPYIAKLPELKLPETTCHPRCRRCHHPEGRGQCAICVLVCDHTTQPANRKPVEVCVVPIRARAVARTARSPGGTRQILVVDHCPHCQHAHVHSAHPGVGAYRRSGCGNPYVLEIR